jgi:hypothetical protein
MGDDHIELVTIHRYEGILASREAWFRLPVVAGGAGVADDFLQLESRRVIPLGNTLQALE